METGKSVLQFQVESVLSRHTSPLSDRFRARYYLYRYYSVQRRGGRIRCLVLKLHRSCQDIPPVSLSSGWIHRSRGIRFFFFNHARLLSVHVTRCGGRVEASHPPKPPCGSWFYRLPGACDSLWDGNGRERAHTPPAKSCLRVRMQSHARLSCAPSTGQD